MASPTAHIAARLRAGYTTAERPAPVVATSPSTIEEMQAIAEAVSNENIHPDTNADRPLLRNINDHAQLPGERARQHYARDRAIYPAEHGRGNVVITALPVAARIMYAREESRDADIYLDNEGNLALIPEHHREALQRYQAGYRMFSDDEDNSIEAPGAIHDTTVAFDGEVLLNIPSELATLVREFNDIRVRALLSLEAPGDSSEDAVAFKNSRFFDPIPFQFSGPSSEEEEGVIEDVGAIPAGMYVENGEVRTGIRRPEETHTDFFDRTMRENVRVVERREELSSSRIRPVFTAPKKSKHRSMLRFR